MLCGLALFVVSVLKTFVIPNNVKKKFFCLLHFAVCENSWINGSYRCRFAKSGNRNIKIFCYQTQPNFICSFLFLDLDNALGMDISNAGVPSLDKNQMLKKTVQHSQGKLFLLLTKYV
jgi:hypothetical protein